MQNTRRWRHDTLEEARLGLMSHLGAMTMATGRIISDVQLTDNRQLNQDNNGTMFCCFILNFY